MAWREYDFKCLVCDHHFAASGHPKEIEEGTNLPTCPSCSGFTKRLFTFGTFTFKGGKPSNDPRYSKERYLT